MGGGSQGNITSAYRQGTRANFYRLPVGLDVIVARDLTPAVDCCRVVITTSLQRTSNWILCSFVTATVSWWSEDRNIEDCILGLVISVSSFFLGFQSRYSSFKMRLSHCLFVLRLDLEITVQFLETSAKQSKSWIPDRTWSETNMVQLYYRSRDLEDILCTQGIVRSAVERSLLEDEA